jgi:hypothetical protein
MALNNASDSGETKERPDDNRGIPRRAGVEGRVSGKRVTERHFFRIDVDAVDMISRTI